MAFEIDFFCDNGYKITLIPSNHLRRQNIILLKRCEYNNFPADRAVRLQI